MSVETQPSAPPESAPSARSDVFDLYLREDDEDRRSLRLSLLVAAVIHIALLAVTLPAMSGPVIPEPEDQTIYLLSPPPRFKNEPPPPPPEQPRKETVRVPMPDTNLDDDEELVLDEPVPVLEPLRTDDIPLPFPDAPPPMEPSGPVTVGGEIERPERVHYVDPAYTEPARKARIQGPVILEAIIDKSGGVKNVRVLRSLPLGLTDSAVNAVRQWRYTPSALNGKPVEVKMTVTVIFNLN